MKEEISEVLPSEDQNEISDLNYNTASKNDNINSSYNSRTKDKTFLLFTLIFTFFLLIILIFTIFYFSIIIRKLKQEINITKNDVDKLKTELSQTKASLNEIKINSTKVENELEIVQRHIGKNYISAKYSIKSINEETLLFNNNFISLSEKDFLIKIEGVTIIQYNYNINKYKFLSPGEYDVIIEFISPLKSIQGLFWGASSLIEIDFSFFNSLEIRDTSNLFRECRELLDVNMKIFDTILVSDMKNMFYNTKKIKRLDISGFAFKNEDVEIDGIFEGIPNNKNVTIIYNYENIQKKIIEKMGNNWKKIDINEIK